MLDRFEIEIEYAKNNWSFLGILTIQTGLVLMAKDD